MEFLTKLDEKFTKRFAKQFAELNANINIIPIMDGDIYEAPIVDLTDGGATVITGPTHNVTLAPSSKIVVDYRRVLALNVIYRISLDVNEAAEASKSDTYFNYIFDPIVNKAIAGYVKAFGGADEIRFGQYFCKYKRADETVFFMTDEGNVEFRLTGSWASTQAPTEAANG